MHNILTQALFCDSISVMDPQNQTPQGFGQPKPPTQNFAPPQTPVYQQTAQTQAIPNNYNAQSQQVYGQVSQQAVQAPQTSSYLPPSGPGGPAVPVPQNMMPTPPPKKKTKLVVLVVFFGFLTLLFAILAYVFYSQMTDYKYNSDQKAEAAVTEAKAEQEKQLNEQFAEKEKEPLKSYTGPVNAAAVKIVYPKTWSLYTVEGTNGNTLSSYFNPNLVPNVANRDNLYAVRLEVLEQPYANTLREFESKVAKGEVKVTPYVAPNVPGSETGVRVDGAITNNTNGSMIIIPVRDKTIKLWTESGSFTNDFDNFVLKNLTFNP